MLRHLNRPSCRNQIHSLITRTFLSDAYKCQESWNARLSTPILEKVKLDNLYYELEQRFQQSGKASSIDVDIFANRVTDDSHTEELADLLHKLRLSEETTKTLDSTGHAFIRNCLENGQIEQMLNVLDDRLNYGVFLDSYSANLALNHLIKAKDFVSAARVATLLMLQEDFNNTIGRYLSLHACIEYLKNPKPLHAEAEAVAAAPTEVVKGKKKDVVKIRVKFLRNEFFDDHFDLKSSNQLVGKTLVIIGKDTPGVVGRSVSLLGLAMYGKFEEAIQYINNLKEDKSVYKDALDKIEAFTKDTTESNPSIEAFNSLVQELRSNQITDNLGDAVKEMMSKTIKSQEAQDIEAQHKVYAEWVALRQNKLDEEMERLQRVKRLKEIEKISKQMQTEEQQLWFFENQDTIELEIEKKKVVYPKRWFGKKKRPRVVDEAYVPPEIRPNRN